MRKRNKKKTNPVITSGSSEAEINKYNNDLWVVAVANTTAIHNTQYTAGFSDVPMTFPRRVLRFPGLFITQLVRCTKKTVVAQSGPNLGWARRVESGFGSAPRSVPLPRRGR